ncbi:thioesterase domain-containing protein [Streptomyces sp. NPDC003401]
MRRSSAVHPTLQNGIPLSCQAVERLLCEICGEHFGHAVSPYDDLFELGGDSLSIIEIATAARALGLPIRSSDVLRHPVPARLAEYLTLPRAPAPGLRPAALDPHAGSATAADPAGAEVRAIPITGGDAAEVLHVVHSESHVRAERDAVAAWVGARAAVGYPLPDTGAPTAPGRTVAELADRCLPALLGHRPADGYRLAGFGHGAVVALELARSLCERGHRVALLALIAPPAGRTAEEPAATLDDLLARRLAALAGRFALTGGESVEDIHLRLREAGWYEDVARPQDLPRLQLAWARTALAVQEYDYPAYAGRAVLVADACSAHPAERAWDGNAERLTVHRLDLGLDCSLPVIGDRQVTDLMRKVLDA